MTHAKNFNLEYTLYLQGFWALVVGGPSVIFCYRNFPDTYSGVIMLQDVYMNTVNQSFI